MEYEKIPEGHWVIHDSRTNKPLFHAKDLKEVMKEAETYNIKKIYLMPKFTHCYFTGAMWPNGYPSGDNIHLSD